MFLYNFTHQSNSSLHVCPKEWCFTEYYDFMVTFDHHVLVSLILKPNEHLFQMSRHLSCSWKSALIRVWWTFREREYMKTQYHHYYVTRRTWKYSGTFPHTFFSDAIVACCFAFTAVSFSFLFIASSTVRIT